MNKYFIHISLGLLLLTSCGTQKGIVKSDAEISKADYAHIEAFHQALRFKTNGRIDEAVAKLEECLAIRQDDDAVFYMLSKLELQRENPDKSSEYIVKAAELDPDNTWYIQELAYMYFEQQEFPKAVENFEKLVEIEPRNVDWLYGYAEALVRNGQEKEAIAALTRTEDQVGKHPQFAIQRYELYMNMKDTKMAEQELVNAKTHFPQEPSIIANLVDHYFKTGQEVKAVSMLEELVAADPNNGRAHLALADIYQKQNDEVKMYDEIRAAFRSTDLDIDTKMKILIRVQESSYKIPTQMYEMVDILVEMYPNNAKAYSIQGDYLLAKEDETGALGAYRKAIELDKSLYPIWNQVLIMEYQAGEYESLFEHSKECLDLFPTMSTVYLLNGVSANQLEKYDEAIEALTYGVEMVANDKPMEAEFYGQLGEAYFGIHKTTEAITSYKKAIDIDPESRLIKNNFARRLAIAKKDLDLAESLALQIVTASPNNGLYKDTYGLVLFQKGDFEKASEYFMQAWALSPNDQMIADHIGDAMIQLGKSKAAIEYWELAKELGSSNKVLDKKIADKKYYDAEY